jgi:SAM-dependent methyltransferase
MLGFEAVGVDIAEPMLALARERDPGGEYVLVPEGDLRALPAGTCDLVLSVFTFDNVPTLEKKAALFRSMKQLLNRRGRIVSLVSTPEIYVNEWASFSTKDFSGNRTARSGESVFTMMLDVADRRPVADVLCTDEDYQEVYRRAGLVPLRTYRPLAKLTEPFPWVSETTIPPWVIYVLGAAE